MRLAVTLACLGLLAGCGAPPADAPPAAAAAPPASPLPDTPLMRELRRAITDCELDEFGSFEGCEGHTYFDGIGALEFEDLRAALALECRLLVEPDPELARLGLARLDWTLSALKRGGRIADDADAALLDCLKARLAAPGPLELRKLVGVYTEFAVGLGRDDEVLAYLREQTDPGLRRAGYVRLWKFGGMRLWPKIERIIIDEPGEIAAAVLAGLEFADLTEGEQATLCTAFAGWFTAPPSPAVRDVAGSKISYQCPKHHPLLLTALRGAIDRGAVDDALLSPVTHLAENCVEVGPETCEEAAALVESVALAASVAPATRETALYSVWRSDKPRGRALASRLEAGAEPQLAGAAKRLLAGP